MSTFDHWLKFDPWIFLYLSYKLKSKELSFFINNQEFHGLHVIWCKFPTIFPSMKSHSHGFIFTFQCHLKPILPPPMLHLRQRRRYTKLIINIMDWNHPKFIKKIMKTSMHLEKLCTWKILHYDILFFNISQLCFKSFHAQNIQFFDP